jgi:four helix bundle protein
MRDFKNMRFGNKVTFTLEIYKITCFSKEELYGLTSQIRRASSSIPTNISEGWEKQ